MSWGGDIVWRYFAPFSTLVFDVGLVRGPASRLYGFCFHSGLPYVHFTDRENIKTGVKHVSKKITREQSLWITVPFTQTLPSGWLLLSVIRMDHSGTDVNYNEFKKSHLKVVICRCYTQIHWLHFSDNMIDSSIKSNLFSEF